MDSIPTEVFDILNSFPFIQEGFLGTNRFFTLDVSSFNRDVVQSLHRTLTKDDLVVSHNGNEDLLKKLNIL